jgi:ribosomal protein L40E
MAETITGKKCPECGSFVPVGAKQCLVCSRGSLREKIKSQPLPMAAAPVKCPKCRQECTPESRFCRYCGSALGQGDVRDTKEYSRKEALLTSRSAREQKRRFIRFDWVKMTPGYTMLNSLDLDADIALFAGYVQWEGYGFFLYQNREKHEILIRKIDPKSAAKLFRKCEKATLVEPRTEIYIGAMGVEVIGSTPQKKQKNDSDTIANVTQYVGPGEKRRSDDLQAMPAAGCDPALIRLLDPDGGAPHIEIREKTLIGRSFLAGKLKIKEDGLRDSGISQEHVHLTPGEEQWLVEPVNRKPVYIEIKETPVIAREGEIFRWMFVDCFGEFKLRVVEE